MGRLKHPPDPGSIGGPGWCWHPVRKQGETWGASPSARLVSQGPRAMRSGSGQAQGRRGLVLGNVDLVPGAGLQTKRPGPDRAKMGRDVLETTGWFAVLGCLVDRHEGTRSPCLGTRRPRMAGRLGAVHRADLCFTGLYFALTLHVSLERLIIVCCDGGGGLRETAAPFTLQRARGIY